MQPWLYGIMGTALICAGICLLYCRGFVVSKSIRAILFVFCPGRDRDRVKLNACTGWLQRVGKFRESRVYDVILDLQLSKGNVEVLLLDWQRQPLLRLNRQSPAGRIEPDRRGRYILRWEFQNATGTCELHW